MIGIIDSGLGAISLLNELIRQKKINNYILFLDYKNNPYGLKDEKLLYKRLLENIKFLKEKGCKNIILACNTLSVIALKYNIKNVITPIDYFKKVINDTFNNKSILLATNYTIKSNVYNVTSRLSSDLVSYIEGKNPMNINDMIKNISEYENIYLGCTHFYLISNKFKDKKIYDSVKVLADNINIKSNNLSIKIYLNRIDKNIINHLMYHIHLKNIKIKCVNN